MAPLPQVKDLRKVDMDQHEALFVAYNVQLRLPLDKINEAGRRDLKLFQEEVNAAWDEYKSSGNRGGAAGGFTPVNNMRSPPPQTSGHSVGSGGGSIGMGGGSNRSLLKVSRWLVGCHLCVVCILRASRRFERIHVHHTLSYKHTCAHTCRTGQGGQEDRGPGHPRLPRPLTTAAHAHHAQAATTIGLLVLCLRCRPRCQALPPSPAAATAVAAAAAKAQSPVLLVVLNAANPCLPLQ